ncbi:hypothetical protein EJB05_40276 [Eragrostis curvula]|uniref:Uncharacterized protein n=1 Tax=Eragrostis curvula TaxID=38414 RepID=A0A5J9U125_9POAL|nr:hypothetical protein EJB05_40276 [Eragrostis curvula]
MNRQLGQAGDSPYCSFHPRELVVGVCASCLKDRLLLLLAAKDGDAVVFRGPALRRRTSSISLPKVFALGSSFLQRIDSRHHQRHHSTYSDDGDDTTSIASLDDSFISIKFEDNGKATWDKAAVDLQSATNKAAAAAPAPVRSSSSSKVGGGGGSREAGRRHAVAQAGGGAPSATGALEEIGGWDDDGRQDQQGGKGEGERVDP